MQLQALHVEFFQQLGYIYGIFPSPSEQTTQVSKSGFKVLLYSNLQEFIGKNCLTFPIVQATQTVGCKASYGHLIQETNRQHEHNTALLPDGVISPEIHWHRPSFHKDGA